MYKSICLQCIEFYVEDKENILKKKIKMLNQSKIVNKTFARNIKFDIKITLYFVNVSLFKLLHIYIVYVYKLCYNLMDRGDY